MINEMPIGAWATVQFNDEDESKTVYVSFGEYNEVDELGTCGVDDKYIFYYFADLKELVEWDSSKNEFSILEYELVYENQHITTGGE
jgi:hypothetical protein